METITLSIGTVVAGSSGQVNDDTRQVEFEAEELASRTEYGTESDGVSITDTRGVTETLYRTADNRLIVHVNSWSRWQGEPDNLYLETVTADDLGPTGRFAQLGQEAGMSRPLTLDEALAAAQAGGSEQFETPGGAIKV